MAKVTDGADWLPRPPKKAKMAGWFELARADGGREWMVLSVVLMAASAGLFAVNWRELMDWCTDDVRLASKTAGMLAIGAAFGMVGLALGVWQGVQRCREPKAFVRADRAGVPLGSGTGIWWEIKARPAWLRRLKRLTVCVEAGGPGRDILARLPVVETSLLSEMVAGHASVEIPRDAMHSLATGATLFQWAVVLKGELQGAAKTWEQRFEMVVLPAAPGRFENWAPDPEALKDREKFEEGVESPGDESEELPGSAPPGAKTGGTLSNALSCLLLVPLVIVGAALLVAMAILSVVLVLPVIGVTELFQRLRYGRRDLNVQLGDEDRAYAPGEQVRGWAEWHIDRPPRAMVVRLFWNEGHAAAEVRLDKLQKQERREFALSVPAGPYTCRGAASVDWWVELRGAGRTAVAWIAAVSPTGRALALKSADRGAKDGRGDAGAA